MVKPTELKAEILRLTREYSRQVHGKYRPANDPERQGWREGDEILRRESIHRGGMEAAVATTLDFG